jgi:hypothetical protein
VPGARSQVQGVRLGEGSAEARVPGSEGGKAESLAQSRKSIL